MAESKRYEALAEAAKALADACDGRVCRTCEPWVRELRAKAARVRRVLLAPVAPKGGR